MTEPVVGLAFLRVGKDFVCLLDLGETCRGVGGLVDVGVILAREPPISLADRVRRRVAFNTEHLVMVLLTSHRGW